MTMYLKRDACNILTHVSAFQTFIFYFMIFYLISNLFLPASPPFMLFIFATQLL